MEAHSLFELNEYIRRVVSLNFREPVWIKAEANQINQSRNNFYIDLVEKKEGKDDIVAQANGVLWARNYFFLKKKLGPLLDDILVDGSEVLLKVKVDFSERYGLKLQIEDIDPSYTLGQAQIRRQEIIEKLKKSGLDEINSQNPLPPVIQKIAVLSSATAAGYKDFVNQLDQNSFGYVYDIDLYPIAVQGNLLEVQIVEAIDVINNSDTSYDCIAIVRGGGSKLDLSWFDTFTIAEKIANASYPVLTGIGHEIDYSIADMVAHTHLKTPTAVADFLIEHNLFFETSITNTAGKITSLAQESINRDELLLEKILLNISGYSLQKLSYADQILDNKMRTILTASEAQIKRAANNLSGKITLINSLEPDNVLKRGYAILYKEKSSIHSVKGIKTGEQFDVELSDGKIKSLRI